MVEYAAVLRDQAQIGRDEGEVPGGAQAGRGLVYGGSLEFPDLPGILDEVSDRVVRALADRFARLALAGALRIRDPDPAAAQWAALLTGPLPARYLFGNESLPEAERDRVVAAAVTTFLAAFGP